jgi:DNA-binding SARP family transcriptional activator
MLGGFEVFADGTAHPLPHGVQRVLAFLALQPRPVQRAYVAGRLWLDSSQQRANASLRTMLWRARVPAGDLLETTSTHVRLDPHVQVDLHELVRSAQQVLESPVLPSSEELARLAHGGELLPDWYDDWLVIERERARQLRRLALERLCDRFSQARRHAEATQAGLAAIDAEPLRESAHRALIRAHYAEGNTVDAIHQYRILATLLHHELGVDPSAETRSIIARGGE